MFSPTRDALMAARTSANQQILRRKDPHHPPFEPDFPEMNSMRLAIRDVLGKMLTVSERTSTDEEPGIVPSR